MSITRPPALRPLPQEAKKVFQGKMFAVYQWPQMMFDGSTVTFEQLQRPDTVNIIPVTKDHKILIGEQEQPGMAPFLGLFGGRVEPEEDPLLAAQRELLEESGYQSDDWQLIQAFQPMEKIDWAIYTFVARNCQPVADQALDSGEKIQFSEVSWEEFLEVVQQPNFRDTEIRYLVLEALVDQTKLTTLQQQLFG